MSKEKLSNEIKKEIFKECGLKPSNKNYNTHHIQFKRDRYRLPREFNLSDRRNLIPLPIEVHNELHKIIDNNPRYRNDISLRVYFANMAWNGELEDIPECMFRTNYQL